MSIEERDDELATLADLDREITELRAVREERARILADPEEQTKRGLRREQVSGRWLMSKALKDAGTLDEIRAASAGEAWLWDPEFLRADGWVEDAGIWRLAARGKADGGARS